MMRKIKAGSTSVSVPIVVLDTTSTTGAGLGGLLFNTAGLAAKYRRQGQSTWTTITLVTMTLGTWVSGGFVADGGGVTGGYELGIPDAAVAAGAKWVEVQLYGVTNMLPVLMFVELDAVDYQDAAAFGLSRVDANISTRAIAGDAMSLTAGALTSLASSVWSAATRLLTAGTNIVLAKGTGVTGFNDLDAAGVQGALTAQGYTATRAGYLDVLNGLVAAIWNAATSTLTTVGSIGKLLVDNITASIAAVKAKTDLIPSAPAAVSDIPTASAIATQVDTTLTTSHGAGTWTTGTGSGGGALTDADVDTILDRIGAVDGSSLRELFRALAAQVGGKVVVKFWDTGMTNFVDIPDASHPIAVVQVFALNNAATLRFEAQGDIYGNRTVTYAGLN